MLRNLLIALVLTFGSPALAASLEEARAGVSAVSAEIARLDAGRQTLAARNEQLANEIAAAKALPRAPLLPGVTFGPLDALLKEAHTVAERLESFDRDAGAARRRLSEARTVLVGAIDERVGALRQNLSQGTPEARRAAFEGLRALLSEREAVLRAELPANTGRRVELPAVQGDSSTPAELRELADEIRDHSEKVRQQLAALDERLSALESRRRLLRAASAFARDEALFDENDRNRRIVRLNPDSVRGLADAQPIRQTPVSVPEASGGTPTPPPPAPGPTEGAQTPADNPGRGQGDSDFGNGAGEDDGAADPQAGGTDLSGDTPPAEPAAPPMAVLADSNAAGPGRGADPGTSLVVEESVDPQLLVGDVEGLSATALAEQIRRVEARRKELDDAARTLEARRKALEKKAVELGGD